MTRFVRNRRDGNHGEIIAALEAAGVRVVDLSDAGGGVPDIACWVCCNECRTEGPPRGVCDRGRWVFIEIKQKRGRMRESQEEFAKRFPVVVARTIEAALAACGIKVAS